MACSRPLEFGPIQFFATWPWRLRNRAWLGEKSRSLYGGSRGFKYRSVQFRQQRWLNQSQPVPTSLTWLRSLQPYASHVALQANLIWRNWLPNLPDRQLASQQPLATCRTTSQPRQPSTITKAATAASQAACARPNQRANNY